MAGSKHDEPSRIEIEVEPSVAGRFAGWTERGRVLRRRAEVVRGHHASVDLAFTIVERDATIGGGMLAGALAYRLFVLLLPSSLLLVSGLGLYADTVNKSTTEAAQDAGLHGLIASEVASSASHSSRVAVFIAMIPAVLYAIVTLYRAIAKVHGIVWYGSGRGVPISARRIAIFTLLLVVQLAALEIVSWIRRSSDVGGIFALFAYFLVVAGSWLVVSTELPHRRVRWPALLPGAVAFALGMEFVNAFNVYVTTRLVEDRADTYGALGVAAALLFSLVLVGRVIVFSAELNSTLDEQRRG
jgi:uncharacterized BrkB/YihY/UPF0761 family membrane protein